MYIHSHKQSKLGCRTYQYCYHDALYFIIIPILYYHCVPIFLLAVDTVAKYTEARAYAFSGLTFSSNGAQDGGTRKVYFERQAHHFPIATDGGGANTVSCQVGSLWV